MSMKLLGVVLVGGLVVGGVAAARGSAPTATPEGRACARIAELCVVDGEDPETAACIDDMKHARKLAGDANFERSAKCADEAKSCAAASGCYAGGVGMGAVGEAMKGFGSALSR